MKCSSCHSENHDSARLCADGGTRFLPSGGIPVSPTVTLKTPPAAWAKGSIFAGKYKIIEELGRGGRIAELEASEADPTRADEVLPKREIKNLHSCVIWRNQDGKSI
jgi:hypothetical protein